MTTRPVNSASRQGASAGHSAPGSDWPSTFVCPAAADGYWLMLEPLPPGRHLINFGGHIEEHGLMSELRAAYSVQSTMTTDGPRC